MDAKEHTPKFLELIQYLCSEKECIPSDFIINDILSCDSGLEKIYAFLHSLSDHKDRTDLLRKIIPLINNSKLLNNLGNKFFTSGQARVAVEFYDAAFQRNPDDPGPLRRKGNALRVIGDIGRAVETYQQALEIRYNADLHSRMLLAMHYETNWSPEELAKEHSAWHGDVDKLRITRLNQTVNFSESKILKIGYVSPDFRSHPVAYFFQPILKFHDRNEFHVTCYSTQSGGDGITRWIKGACDQWRDVDMLSATELAKMVQSDEIDILIDLAGHSSGNRLDVFRLKPAPIQITYLGYPNGTGIPEMDYRITDQISDPPGSTEHLYVEELIRINPCFLTFEPPKDTPDVAVSPLFKNGFVTFGSFNKFSKLSNLCIETWVDILNCVPDSRLFLKTGGLEDSEEKRKALDRFGSAGLADVSRVDIHDLVPSRTDHLRLYERIDIALDPFPYNGTTTTCQALWMGVPVISLRGDRHVARVGASILSQMGLEKLVADTTVDYIEIASRLAMDHEKLLNFRKRVRPLMEASPLLDHNGYVKKLENMFRAVWTRTVQRSL
jgi:predicted O-linked N-acetylglucosamine transferase (SPINDLY family)